MNGLKARWKIHCMTFRPAQIESEPSSVGTSLQYYTPCDCDVHNVIQVCRSGPIYESSNELCNGLL